MANTGNILYQFIYNRVAKDQYLYNKMNGINDADTDGVALAAKATEEYNKFIVDTVKGYQSTNLKQAIDSHREIMINCQTYYAVRYTQWHILVYEFFKAFGDKMPDTETLREFLR